MLTSSLRSLIIWNWVSADVKRELTAGWYSDTFSVPAEGAFHFTFMINLYFYCHLYSYWYWYRSSSRSATHCQFRPEALFTRIFTNIETNTNTNIETTTKYTEADTFSNQIQTHIIQQPRHWRLQRPQKLKNSHCTNNTKKHICGRGGKGILITSGSRAD